MTQAEYEARIINHARIEITDKTNAKTVVLETRADNADYTHPGEYIHGKFVLTGMPLKEAVDNSLDSFSFIIKESDTKKPFRPYDLATLTVVNGTEGKKYEMVILSDHVETLSRMHQTYTHTVTAIESTKILEKVKIFNLNLTNPHDDLLKQFKKALNNAELVCRSIRTEGQLTYTNFERKQRFAISRELEEFLSGKPSGDFYSGNTDLRAVLDKILATLNARVEVKRITFTDGNISEILLGYRSMTAVRNITPIWTEDEQGEIIGEELYNDGQNVAGKIVARGYNTVSREPLTFTDIFKSGNDTVSDETACIFFPFPIGEGGITKFVLQYECTTNGSIFPVNVDIASHFIPQEQFDLLSESDRQSYIPYNIGSDRIAVGSHHFNSFLGMTTKLNIRKIIEEVLNSYIVSGAAIIDLSVAYYKRPFTITYYPQVNTTSELDKPNTYDKDELLLGITDNQNENTLDMERHGRRLSSLIRRTGNGEYYLDVKATSFSKLLPMMAVIDMPSDKLGYKDESYVIYKREMGLYPMFVKCRYYLSKNFNAVQEFAGVMREKHLFDIPLESDECPLLLKQYMVFGTSAKSGTRGFQESFLKGAMQTLFCTSTVGQIKYCLFKSYEESEYFPQYTESVDNSGNVVTPYNYDDVFMRPCLSYGQATVMNFVANVLDNYSVDYSRAGYVFSIWGDGGHKVTYNRYVSNKEQTAGECVQFHVDYAYSCRGIDDISTLDDETVRRFPVAQESLFSKATQYPFQIDYYKDRTQKPVFCYAIECIPAEEDYGKIMIGPAFCKCNNLVTEKGTTQKSLKLMISFEQEIDQTAEFLPNGYDSGAGVSALFSTYFELVTDPSTPVNARLRYKGDGSDAWYQQVKSWALYDESTKEIYLAVNDKLRDIYVTIKDFPS